jgi:hypothetical protein
MQRQHNRSEVKFISVDHGIRDIGQETLMERIKGISSLFFSNNRHVLTPLN